MLQIINGNVENLILSMSSYLNTPCHIQAAADKQERWEMDMLALLSLDI